MNMFKSIYICISFISYSLISITYSQPIDLCSTGCQLLFNQELPCDSHYAFIPNSYITETTVIDINSIRSEQSYICFTPNYIINEGQAQNTNNYQLSQQGVFTLDSPVLIWQAIIISIIVPLMALLIFKLVLVLCNKCMECCADDKSKCGFCLYCCSRQYRQRSRNRRFHNDIYNNADNDGKKWWMFGRKNSDNLQQNDHNVIPIIVDNDDDDDLDEYDGNDMDRGNVELGKRRSIDLGIDEGGGGNNNNNEYHNVPLDDNGNHGVGGHVLEELSVNDHEMAKYLQAPGGNTQDIELSFSSQGLRQICERDVV